MLSERRVNHGLNELSWIEELGSVTVNLTFSANSSLIFHFFRVFRVEEMV